MEGQYILARVEVIQKEKEKKKEEAESIKNQKKGSKSFSTSANQSVFV